MIDPNFHGRISPSPEPPLTPADIAAAWGDITAPYVGKPLYVFDQYFGLGAIEMGSAREQTWWTWVDRWFKTLALRQAWAPGGEGMP
ncbi:hypothetical protein HN371_29420 [Candidatus Poribacteria bacterium]|jgi:hypothetical protein|nr:hypothetical protein [Candidatus Poribacteria bacterium]MBT7096597.1 hypothetical protein [Candidatus Poribacteria bacterium]